MKSLADLEAELVQKSSVYSEEHPVVKALKKKIAALKHVVAARPRTAPATDSEKSDVGVQVLEQRALDLGKSLEDANRKLSAARLGESMERNKQSEHLQLIESPELPHKPVRPKKIKIVCNRPRGGWHIWCRCSVSCRNARWQHQAQQRSCGDRG